MTLEQAYRKACFADDSIREQLLAEENKAKEEKRKAEEEARAKQARRAGAANVRGDIASPSPKSLDAKLDEVWDKHFK